MGLKGRKKWFGSAKVGENASNPHFGPIWGHWQNPCLSHFKGGGNCSLTKGPEAVSTHHKSGKKNNIRKISGPKFLRASWPVKSCFPSPESPENTPVGADVHDVRHGHPWPEGLSKTFVQKNCFDFLVPSLIAQTLLAELLSGCSCTLRFFCVCVGWKGWHREPSIMNRPSSFPPESVKN